MLTEKILFQNSSLAFYYHPRPPPPPRLAKDHFFSGFFFRTLPLCTFYSIEFSPCKSSFHPVYSSFVLVSKKEMVVSLDFDAEND